MDLSSPSCLHGAHLRVARPTDQLDAVCHFYEHGLGFEVLYRFSDHQGFDGVMLGLAGSAYHLEFTHHHGHPVGRAPSQDHLLVFYLPQLEVWQLAHDRLIALGYPPVPSYNPYWDERGRTFEDPDGYRIVLQHASWS